MKNNINLIIFRMNQMPEVENGSCEYVRALHLDVGKI